MTNLPPRSEIGSPSRELPASEGALLEARTALEGFRFVDSARDLTAVEVFDPLDPGDDAIDTSNNWPDERIIGKQWVQTSEDDALRVHVYDNGVRNALGDLFSKERGTFPGLHLHGQLSFHRKIGGSYFTGVIYFLGDGDKIEEMEAVTAYSNGDTEDPDAGFDMMQFATKVGLNRLLADSQRQPELPYVQLHVRARKGVAEDIAQSMKNLLAEASTSET